MSGEHPEGNPIKDRQIRRRLLIGTTSNFIGQMVIFLVSFLLTPFLLTKLGAADYGLWVLLGSIVAFGSILDFGLWGTVIKYVAEYQARGDFVGVRAETTGDALAGFVQRGARLTPPAVYARGVAEARAVKRLHHLEYLPADGGRRGVIEIYGLWHK